MLKVAQVLAVCLISNWAVLPLSASEASENAPKSPISSKQRITDTSFNVVTPIVEDNTNNSIVWFIDFEQANNEIKRQLQSQLKPLMDLNQYRNDIILLHKYRFRHVAGVNQLQTTAPYNENIAD
jgi:hypothetical protein